jgi:hypothetical protein
MKLRTREYKLSVTQFTSFVWFFRNQMAKPYAVINVVPFDGVVVADLPFEVVKTQFNKDGYIVEHHTYRCDRRVKNKTQISARCEARETGCRATVRLNPATKMCTQLRGAHNHLPFTLVMGIPFEVEKFRMGWE